jgi:uncharacterized protein (TIGR03083 family)
MKLAPRYDGSSILSIDRPPDDQQVPLTRQRLRLQASLRELDETAWAAPSRCAGWTVQDVVAHLVGVNAFWSASVAAGLAGEPTRMLAAFDPAKTPPMMVAGMRALRASDVLEQFATSNEDFLDAIAALGSADWAAVAESPAGHVSIRLLAHHALWDSWIHERDIAIPLGLTLIEEPDEVAACLRYSAAISPALAIASGQDLSGVFAVEATDPSERFTLAVRESVAVRDGVPPSGAPCLRGDAVQLVEALSIRTALPASAPREWRQLLSGLATAFDSELELG